MNITKELLEYLGVKSIIITENDTDSICYLRQQNKNCWTLFLANRIEFGQEKILTLQINFYTGSISFPVSLAEYGEDYCRIILPDTVEDTRLQEFISALLTMEYKDEKYGRRQEQRIEIGKANSKAFGLSSPQQTVFLYGIHFQQPCAVVDASMHGIQIITPYGSSEIRNINNFNIKLNFTEPEQNIILQVHKVHVRLTKTGEKSFANISCQILEPVHFVWKERIIRMFENNGIPGCSCKNGLTTL